MSFSGIFGVLGFEPTYKGLKHNELRDPARALRESFEPTYKGLKPGVSLPPFPGELRFEPTYKGLKRDVVEVPMDVGTSLSLSMKYSLRLELTR